MIGRIAAGVFGIGAAGLAWGVTEANLFALRRYTVPVLPAGQRPIRVLHVSDMHLLPNQRWKQTWVSKLAELEPDLVVNTGDNMATEQAMGAVLQALDGLLDCPGVFVFGSNDYTGPVFKNPLGYVTARKHGRYRHGAKLPSAELSARFESRGWVNLTNTSTTLTVAGREVDFRGTDDAHLKLDRYAQVAGPVAADRLTIGVTHAPYLRVLDAMTADGVGLIMAGHTHGGQVCLPVKGAIITNCDLEPARAKGLHPHHAGTRTSWLHVSAGIGASPYAPYRTFCRPEASLLTLVPAP